MLAGALCFILCSHLHTPHASSSASFPMLLFLRMIACAISIMMTMTMVPRAWTSGWQKVSVRPIHLPPANDLPAMW